MMLITGVMTSVSADLYKAAAVSILIFIVIAPFAIYNFSRTKAFKEGEL